MKAIIDVFLEAEVDRDGSKDCTFEVLGLRSESAIRTQIDILEKAAEESKSNLRGDVIRTEFKLGVASRFRWGDFEKPYAGRQISIFGGFDTLVHSVIPHELDDGLHEIALAYDAQILTSHFAYTRKILAQEPFRCIVRSNGMLCDAHIQDLTTRSNLNKELF